MPDVSVVIPARNAAQTIGDGLAALQAQTPAADLEVIVVVDGDDEATARAVTAVPSSPRLEVMPRLPSGDPSGPGEKRNRGVEVSTAPVIAFTDADCRPAPGWLAAGLDAIRAAALVQGAIAAPADAEPGPYDRVVTVAGDSGLFETANLFVRRDVFARVGGFEDWHRAAGSGGRPFGEDAWFGWRARRAGVRTRFSADALVHHMVFEGTAVSFVIEHARRRFFPELVAQIPELRQAFCYRRYFLNDRTAKFDLAVVGSLLGIASRRRTPLLATLPYVIAVGRELRRHPDVAGARLESARLAADLVTLGSLAWGSIRARRLLV